MPKETSHQNLKRNARHWYWQFQEVIDEFKRLGFEIVRISADQYRINDCIDIYPANKQYHDLKTGGRGDIRGIGFKEFLKNYFNFR